jgi:hypothetical protein
MGWAYAAAGNWLSRTSEGQVSAANQPWIVNLLARRPAVMAPRFQDQGQFRRYLARYRPGTLTLFITEREPEDVAVAHRLVENLWSQPRLDPSLADVLQLEVSEHGTTDGARQALLIFSVSQEDE